MRTLGAVCGRGLGVVAMTAAMVAADTGPALAQPSTDVVVLDLRPHGDHVHVGSMVPVSERDGYDNQPHFRDHDRLLLVSDRDGPGTDVYGFSVVEGEPVRLTRTPESEYSPRVTPDGTGFSVVRAEEAGGGGVQGLFVYPLVESEDGDEPAGLDDARRLLPEVDDIGYYAWLNETEVALFRLGDPPSLHLADVETGEVRHVADDIGPSVQPIPGRDAVSFVDASGQDAWTVRVLEAGSAETTAVAELPLGVAEHAWLSEFNLLMGHEGILYRFPVDREEEWVEMAELGPVVGNFTRIAVSPHQTRIAVVVEDGG